MVYLTPEQRQAAAQKSVATRRRNKNAREAEQARQQLLAQELMSGVSQARQKLAEVKAELTALAPMHGLSTRSKQLTGRYMLTEDQIVAHAISWQRPIGVYFLIHASRVVYVGQSTNIYARVCTHTDKKFDSVAFLPCDRNMLDKVESLYIHCLRPPLNSTRDDGRAYAPIDLNVLLRETNA